MYRYWGSFINIIFKNKKVYKSGENMRIIIEEYLVDNKKYNYISLFNKSKMEIKLSTCGAGIREVRVPNEFGVVKTVTLTALSDELYNSSSHGKSIGRTSGRIENATFTIDDKTAFLDKNNRGIDNLHGGKSGFHKQNFNFSLEENQQYTDVVFTYFSPDGEGGYFGNVMVSITYRVFEEENRFRITINGKSDCKNILNITNHVYWNLSGDLSENILEHEMFLDASRRGKLNSRLILTEIIPVSQEFDFRNGQKIGTYILSECVQEHTTGYDHPFYLDNNNEIAASLYSEKNNLRLNVKTSYPSIVCYSDNYPFQNTEILKNVYDSKYMAICLECQYSPNGLKIVPEKAGVFNADEEYNEYIEYEFIIAAK